VIREAPSERRVEAMFDSVVERYDLVNLLLSLGLDRRWRVRTAEALAARGEPVLDFGCGTGRLGELLAGRARVVGLDLSQRMLASARGRLGSRMALVRGSVFALPFGDGVFAEAMSAFVLRNLDDLPRAFSELARVVVPGGGLAVVDISGPRRRLPRKAFDAYFGAAASLLGRLAGEAEAYRYLTRSLAQLPTPEVLCSIIEKCGFGAVEAHPFDGGMVTLWTAMRNM